VSVYVDANVLVALFVPDSLSARASALIGALSDPIVVSDLAELEVASAIARMTRAKELSPAAANHALANFDAWIATQSRFDIHPADVAAAGRYVRRFEINLHGADALHVAMAARAGASLLTLDAKMKANARKAGVPVV
jgi:hypothetical protein